MRSAEVTFRVYDAATKPMEKIIGVGKNVDHTMQGVSKSFDDLDSPKNKNSIQSIGREVEGLGRKTTEMEANVKRSTEATGRSFEQMRDKGAKSIEELTALIKRFEHERATAQLDVDITKAEAKIRLLKQQVRSLSDAEARKEFSATVSNVEQLTKSLVGGGGGGGPPGLGGGGIPGGGGGGLLGGLKQVGEGVGMMGAAIVLALPIIVALTGAISALIGSLGAAALGAGAVGVGVFGAAAVGIGAIAAIAVPAVKQLQAVKKAQDAYNKSVQTFGRDSAQAAKAHKALVDEEKKAPGAGSVLQNVHVLGSRFRQATGSGRRDFFGGINDVLQGANAMLPQFARTANEAMHAVRDAVHALVSELTTPEMKGVIRSLGDTFAAAVGPAAQGIGQLATFFARVARAASPMVIQLFESFNHWATGLAGSARNAGRVQGIIENLVDHTKAWWNFLKAAGHLLFSFFGAGAKQGKSMLGGITDQLNKWATWIDKNPDKMHAFFSRTISAARQLAGALFQVAKTLGELGDGLMPILNMLSTITSATGQSGALGPLAAYGAYRFFTRGKGGGLVGRAAGRAVAGGTAAEAGAAAAGAGGGIISRTLGRAAGGGAAAEALGATGLTGRIGAGALAKGLGMGLLRKAGPLALAFGAYDFLSAGGGLGHRLGATANGALFGVPQMLGLFGGPSKPQVTPDQRVADFVQAHPHLQAQQRQATHLEHLLRARTTLPGQYEYRDGTNVQRTRYTLQGNARKDVQGQLDKLRPVIRAHVVLEGKAQAQKTMDDVINAFDIRWQQAGSKSAERGLFKDLRNQAAKLGPEGRTQLRNAEASWTAELEHGTPKQKQIARDLKDYITKQFRDMGKNVEVVNGKILSGTTTEWQGIQAAMTSASEGALQEVKANFTALQKEAVGSLMAMGMSKGAATSYVQGQENIHNPAPGHHITPASAMHAGDPGGAGTPNVRKAMGGRLAGIGRSDSVNLGGGFHAAPDELVVDRHSERKLDQRLGYRGATDFIVRNNHTPHNQDVYAAAGARRASATAGGSDLRSQVSLAGVHPSVIALARRIENRWPGLTITSGTGGGHAADSYHYRGEAVDLAGPGMDAAARWIGSVYGSQLTEGIHNPNLSIKGGKHVSPSFWGSSVWAEHANHIHVALAGALAAAAGGPAGGAGGDVHLHRPRSRLAGVPGALSNRATDIVAGALEAHLNDYGGGGAGGATSAGGQYNKSQLARLWRRAGGPAGVANLMAAIALAESGGNPNAGHQHPYHGLWQVGPGGSFDPMTNAREAVGKYKTQGLRAWETWTNGAYKQYMAMGGRVPMAAPNWGGWHGDGGDFTVARPTLIGVGERGKERVRITPEGAGGDRPIHVHIGHITQKEEGDTAEIIERELRKVARAVSTGFGGGDEMSD